MPEQNALAAIAENPLWFPFQLDASLARIALLRMSEEEYRTASFLDQRLIGPDSSLQVADWPSLARAIPRDARRDIQYVFHLGNVGSTLVSRLLGELENVFALREPMLLRTYAEVLGPVPPRTPWTVDEAESRLDALTALLSRTFRPEQRALVKATSFVSEIADRLVPAGSRALFLFATPEHYIENLLAGENSRQVLPLLAPGKLERLRSRCPGMEVELESLSDAHKAALGWACEMTSMESAASILPSGDCLWLDFDLFLEDRTAHFMEIARFFDHPTDAETAHAICEGPLIRRYSKALEYDYSPDLRRDILAQARAENRRSIIEALDWLWQLGSRHPAVATALRRAQRTEGSDQ